MGGTTAEASLVDCDATTAVHDNSGVFFFCRVLGSAQSRPFRSAAKFWEQIYLELVRGVFFAAVQGLRRSGRVRNVMM